MSIENVFSWSKSRDEEFRECERKYFYGRYASWGGWDPNAPSRTRLAYILKNLKNRWAWKGETVHHVIESVLKALKNGRPVSLDSAVDHLTRVMRRSYLSSKAKKYYENPKNNPGLFEHEYERPVSDDIWKQIHEEAVECVRNFYRSDLFQELTADDKNDWLVIEDLEEFDFEGAKIFVKLDFARKKNDRIEIYDWKTGKSNSEASIQIGAYALYATQKWQVPVNRIRAYLFNVAAPSSRPEECAVSESLIAESRAVIAKSIANMRHLLADPSRNVPKPESDFKFTENTALCKSCNFYKICEKYRNP